MRTASEYGISTNACAAADSRDVKVWRLDDHMARHDVCKGCGEILIVSVAQKYESLHSRRLTHLDHCTDPYEETDVRLCFESAVSGIQQRLCPHCDEISTYIDDKWFDEHVSAHPKCDRADQGCTFHYPILRKDKEWLGKLQVLHDMVCHNVRYRFCYPDWLVHRPARRDTRPSKLQRPSKPKTRTSKLCGKKRC